MSQHTVSPTATSEMARPAIQLYSLRSLPASLPETIRRVAEAGYEGVEFADQFLAGDPHEVRSVLVETKTVPVAAHVDLSRLERDAEAVVDRCRRVGCRRVVLPHIGAQHFRTANRVDALADRLETLADRLEADGIKLTYHNAREPFLPMLDQFGLEIPSKISIPAGGWNHVGDGLRRAFRFDEGDIADRTGFGRLLERTSDRITFEIDVGWVAAAGYDPTAVFDLLGERLALVHVADVTMTRRFPPAFRSSLPGAGIIDLDCVVSAAHDTDAEWLVFEDDDPDDAEVCLRQGVDIVTS